MYGIWDNRMMVVMTFHQKLVKICGVKGWKQAELARRVPSVSRNTVSRWWNGEIKPFDDEAIKLARILGVSLDYLADDAVEELPSAETLRDEHLVIETFHSIGIPAREAVRRLHGGDHAVIVAFRELQITPEEAIRRMRGEIVAGPSREEPEAGRKTRGEGGKPDFGGKKKGVS